MFAGQSLANLLFLWLKLVCIEMFSWTLCFNFFPSLSLPLSFSRKWFSFLIHILFAFFLSLSRVFVLKNTSSQNRQRLNTTHRPPSHKLNDKIIIRDYFYIFSLFFSCERLLFYLFLVRALVVGRYSYALLITFTVCSPSNKSLLR